MSDSSHSIISSDMASVRLPFSDPRLLKSPAHSTLSPKWCLHHEGPFQLGKRSYPAVIHLPKADLDLFAADFADRITFTIFNATMIEICGVTSLHQLNSVHLQGAVQDQRRSSPTFIRSRHRPTQNHHRSAARPGRPPQATAASKTTLTIRIS